MVGGIILKILTIHALQIWKTVLKYRISCFTVALATILLLAFFDSRAFTLGDMRGSAVIGRTLDVTVQVLPGPGEDISASCLAADVYFAEAHQTTPFISVVEPAGSSGQIVRLRSSAIVDEPYVTILLRTTCGASSLRRYVLLSDLPQSVALGFTGSDLTGVQPLTAPANAVMAPTVIVLPERKVQESQQSRISRSPATVRTNKPSAGKARKLTTPAELNVHKAVDRPTGQSLLKLDPLGVLSDKISSLDSAMLFSPPEDALRMNRQISSLQAEMKAIREMAAKHESKVLELRTQLIQAQSQKIPRGLIYLLIALAVSGLAMLAWMGHRRVTTQGQAWWHDRESDHTVPMPHLSDDERSLTPGKLVTAAEPAKDAPMTSDSQRFAKPSSFTDAALDRFMSDETPSKTPRSTGLASSESSSSSRIHHISDESILDIRQQAEFFVSLGQTDRALRILKNQISESADPNPFVCLDLAVLYHSLGMKAEFLEQRDFFTQHFNGNLPDFPDFHQEGKDLESYPEVMSKLAQLWTDTGALAFLDTCVFHDPQMPLRLSFDLAAFRDLLTLHVLASEVSHMPTVTAPSAQSEVTDPGVSYELPVPDDAEIMDLTETPQAMLPDILLDSLPDLPMPKPLFPKNLAQVPAPLPDLPSVKLDMDFSILAGLAGSSDPVNENEPLITPPFRYATRSRWPVTKKPK